MLLADETGCCDLLFRGNPCWMWPLQGVSGCAGAPMSSFSITARADGDPLRLRTGRPASSRVAGSPALQRVFDLVVYYRISVCLIFRPGDVLPMLMGVGRNTVLSWRLWAVK